MKKAELTKAIKDFFKKMPLNEIIAQHYGSVDISVNKGYVKSIVPGFSEAEVEIHAPFNLIPNGTSYKIIPDGTSAIYVTVRFDKGYLEGYPNTTKFLRVIFRNVQITEENILKAALQAYKNRKKYHASQTKRGGYYAELIQ